MPAANTDPELHAASASDPEVRTPLARFHGERPPAPAWFERAIALEPERSFVEVEGASIELLAWGERGRPGLLFLHGGGAHADWWSFIAPFFADTYRIAAISLSGMGRSSWREAYSLDLFADEAETAARAAGLFDAAVPPVVIGHSFGSRPTLVLSTRAGVEVGGAVILDAAISPPPETLDFPGRPTRIFPSFEAGVEVFRLAPSQPCPNLFLVDHIARHSLRSVTQDDGSEGWTWRFDPRLWGRMRSGLRQQADEALRAMRIPIALIRGQHSLIVKPANLAYTRSIGPADMADIVIPEAGHHLFLDQPIAVVSALRAVLAGMDR